MDREIIEEKMLDGVESRSGDPAVVPMKRKMNTEDIASDSLGNGLTQVAEVRGPASVLVHSEPNSGLVRRRSQLPAGGKIKHEWLLAEYVFSSMDRVTDDFTADQACGELFSGEGYHSLVG